MKNIKTHLLINFTVIIILSNIIIGLILFSIASGVLEREGKSKLQNIASTKVSEYEKDFNHAVINVKALALMVEKTLNYKAFKGALATAYKYNKTEIPYIGKFMNTTVAPILYNLTADTPQVLGGYFSLDPDLIKHKYAIDTWYTRIKPNDKLKIAGDSLRSTYYPADSSALAWFYNPKKIGAGNWSNVYVDNDINVKMISYSTPVYSNKNFIGVVGMDISIEQLLKSASGIRVYNTGYAYLLDKNFKLLSANSDEKTNLTPGLNEDLYKNNYINNKVIEVKENGKAYLIVPTYLSNGLIFLIKAPKDEVLSELNNLKAMFFFILACFLLISTGVSLKLSEKLAEPIEKITDISKKITNGEYSTKISGFENNISEINNLVDAFRSFVLLAKTNKENEQKYFTILNNISEGLLILDSECNILSCNLAAKKMFEYEENELVGEKINALISSKSLNNEQETIDEYYFINKSIEESISLVGLTKNSLDFPINFLTNKIEFEEQLLYVVIIRDITKEKAAEKTKNDFISMISHELRTPLTSIRGSLGLVTSGVLGEISDKVRQLLNIASNNSIRLVNLINDILDVEKIKAGKMTYKFGEYKVMPLVEEAVSFNNDYAKQYNVSIEIKERIDDVIINVDKDKFIQVLTNLLSNASKFSTPETTIEINVKKNKQLIKIEVINQGSGISEENKSKIFSNFYQEDSVNSRSKGGTGLGLSICKLLVNNMGGNIGFDSEVNKTTTFYFEFPEMVSTKIKRVALIVEDNKTTAKGIQIMLQELGFNSDIAINAEEAKKMLKIRKYDLLTLDLILPDVNGLTLLDEIKSDNQTKDLPVIIVSAANKEKASFHDESKYKVIDWLDKSFDINALQDTISKIMEEKNEKRINILHVEDDEDILNVTSATLDSIANVTSVKNIAQAEEVINKDVFELIILDYKLPEGNCDELIFSIKKSINKSAKIIVFTAYEISDFLASQADAVIQKTKVSNEQFCECIEKFINKKDNI